MLQNPLLDGKALQSISNLWGLPILRSTMNCSMLCQSALSSRFTSWPSCSSFTSGFISDHYLPSQAKGLRVKWRGAEGMAAEHFLLLVKPVKPNLDSVQGMNFRGA